MILHKDADTVQNNAETGRPIDAELTRLGSLDVHGWQPIETFDHALAFKGVLVVDRGHVGEAYYDGESDSWWLANTSEHDFDACHAIYPTHWMPLPDPPVSLHHT